MVLPSGQAWRARCWGETEALANEGLEAKIAAALGEHDGTLRSYAENVYAPKIRHKSAKWRSQVIWVSEGYILPAFGHFQLRDIKRPRVQAFFNDLVASGKIGRTSIGHVRKVFSAMMRLAWHDELIDRNPVEMISLPDPEETDVTIWSVDQLARIVVCAQGSPWQLPLFLAGFFGMRLGESLGPRLEDLGTDFLDLDYQVQMLPIEPIPKSGPKKAAVHKNKLKTPGSHRSFPLPGGAYARILAMRCASLRAESSPLLCPNERGGLMNPENASIVLTRAIDRANETIAKDADKIPHGTYHHLRHSFAAALDDMGCPAVAKRELMGHAGKNPSERYGGAYLERKREVLGILLEHLERNERLLKAGRKVGRTWVWSEVESGPQGS